MQRWNIIVPGFLSNDVVSKKEYGKNQLIQLLLEFVNKNKATTKQQPAPPNLPTIEADYSKVDKWMSGN